VTEIANRDQYDAWNGDSGERWVADADRRDRVMAPVADALLARAEVSQSENVLDIGCGCGATTLGAAEAAGPDGLVLGIDLSAPMLEVARQRAQALGLANVAVVQGDAQSHALPQRRFDVAISRFGTMFFADPAAAFTNIAGFLRVAGRVVIATWQPLVANEWLTVPGAALLRYGSLPDGGNGPGMFAQSEPDVIVATLQAGGFEVVEVEPTEVTVTLGADTDDATNYLASSGIGRAVLATVAEDQRPAALAAVRGVLAEHAGGDGVRLRAAIWVTRVIRAA
jgi:SAM-dependent methyltransferase